MRCVEWSEALRCAAMWCGAQRGVEARGVALSCGAARGAEARCVEKRGGAKSLVSVVALSRVASRCAVVSCVAKRRGELRGDAQSGVEQRCEALRSNCVASRGAATRSEEVRCAVAS